MRILHIEAGRHLYGGASQVRLLVDGLAAVGVDNVLVCARGGALAASSTAARVVAPRLGGDLDVGALVRVRRAIRAFEPDAVHVHSRRGADLWGGAAAALARVPAVLTRRVDSAEPGAWARLKYRPYVRVVALSRAIEKQLRGCGVSAERIVRIPSAVDGARYRPSNGAARERLIATFGLPRDALIVGVVAQLIERKGHARLLDALPEVVRREPRVRVVCFGRGPLEAGLRAALAELGLDGHVRLVGFRGDLPDLMPGFDLLAHPARREGLGAALLEAASSGLAIVAAPAGGVGDIVEHGRTGWLVDFDERAAVADALVRLLADPELRRRLGRAAREDVGRRFTVDAMVGAHVRLYEAVVRDARARRSSARARPRAEPQP